MRVVLATKNEKKRRELVALLEAYAPHVTLVTDVDWPDVDETGDTFEENARLKARAVYEATGVFALADDSGLEVDALGGAPGVVSARFAALSGRCPEVQGGVGVTGASGLSGIDVANNAELLERLRGVADRTGRFRCVVALCGIAPDGSMVDTTVEGRVEGWIEESPSGGGGFGYDPLFRPEGWDHTFGEAGAEEKAAVSHRGEALRAAAGILAELSGRG